MNKRTIAILSVVGIVLNVIAYARLGRKSQRSSLGASKLLWSNVCGWKQH